MTSPAGFSAGGNSSMGAGGLRGTGLVGTGSAARQANASWTGPRACTSTPCGTAGSATGTGDGGWAAATTTEPSTQAKQVKQANLATIGNPSQLNGAILHTNAGQIRPHAPRVKRHPP